MLGGATRRRRRGVRVESSAHSEEVFCPGTSPSQNIISAQTNDVDISATNGGSSNNIITLKTRVVPKDDRSLTT